MEPEQMGGKNLPNSNMERLRELNDFLTYDYEGANELLIKVNDELTEIRKELNNGRGDKSKVNICRQKVDKLINELRNSILKNVTREQ